MAGALPTPVKTWQTPVKLVNTLTGTMLTTQRNLVYQIITNLIAMGWVTKGSSDNSTAGMDGVNRILSGANFVHGGGSTFSWWCGQNGAGAQVILWDSSEAFGVLALGVNFAPSGGFAGGSTTAIPTATASFAVSFMCSEILGNSDFTTTMLMMSTSDTASTRIALMNAGTCYWFMAIEQAGDARTGWPGNFIMANARTNNANTEAALIDWFNRPSGVFNVHSYVAGGLASLVAIAQSASADPGATNWVDAVTIVSDLNGLYDLSPALQVGNYNDTGKKGIYGRIEDMHVVPAVFADGSTAPLDGSRKWIIVGNLFMPWGGVSVTGDVGDFDFVPDNSQCPVVPTPTPVLTEITRGPNPNVGTDFGIDVDALTDVPLDWVLCSGPRNLGNALGRRLRTVLGALASDPNYGFDLRDMLNAGVDQSRMGALRGQIIAEIEKDPRVDSVTTLDFLFNASTQQFSINLEVQTATGPFTLIVPVGTP